MSLGDESKGEGRGEREEREEKDQEGRGSETEKERERERDISWQSRTPISADPESETETEVEVDLYSHSLTTSQLSNSLDTHTSTQSYMSPHTLSDPEPERRQQDPADHLLSDTILSVAEDKKEEEERRRYSLGEKREEREEREDGTQIDWMEVSELCLRVCLPLLLVIAVMGGCRAWMRGRDVTVLHKVMETSELLQKKSGGGGGGREKRSIRGLRYDE